MAEDRVPLFVRLPQHQVAALDRLVDATGLRKHGHDVHPVTLTGLGDRVHLARSDVGLETHITDVVNLLDYEDLRDVVLVGHSYAGVVVTGVADRRPERLAAVVYLDTGPL